MIPPLKTLFIGRTVSMDISSNFNLDLAFSDGDSSFSEDTGAVLLSLVPSLLYSGVEEHTLRSKNVGLVIL